MSSTGALVGGTAELWISGRKMLLATGCDFSQAQALVRVDVIGDVLTQEILTDSVTVSFSASAVWGLANDWYSIGVIAADGPTIVLLPAVTAVVRNNVNNEIVTSVRGLKLESMGLRVQKNAAVMTNVSMQGIAMARGVAASA